MNCWNPHIKGISSERENMEAKYNSLQELLIDYPEKPLGQATDYTGKHINQITLLKRINNPNKYGNWWAAQCDCLTFFPVYVANVIQGKQKSCGCLRHRPQYTDITGQIFGELTAIRHIEGSNPTEWECLCSCGSKTIVRAGNLFSGHTRSCGHLETQKLLPTKMKDLTGQRCGKLVALYPFYKGRVMWHCQCDCGKFVDISSSDFIAQAQLSCGCLRQSKREFLTEQWLQKYNFRYEQEIRIPELHNVRFDFKIYKDKEKWVYLELQGEQHYMPIEHFGGQQKFEKQQFYDNEKRKYCKENDIILYEIRYDENLEQKLTSYFLTSNDYHSGE